MMIKSDSRWDLCLRRQKLIDIQIGGPVITDRLKIDPVSICRPSLWFRHSPQRSSPFTNVSLNIFLDLDWGKWNENQFFLLFHNALEFNRISFESVISDDKNCSGLSNSVLIIMVFISLSRWEKSYQAKCLWRDDCAVSVSNLLFNFNV